MKKLHTTFGLIAVVIVVVIALFSNHEVQDLSRAALHEIRTFDAWKQSAYTPGSCPLPGRYQQAAFTQAPPIMQGEKPPQLIKEMGMEVVPVSGGKVKITGIMGNSWADRAGLKVDDIILRFNKKKLSGLDQFEEMVSTVSPEKDYPIKVLRMGRVKKLRVTIGEGEMEGFTPIVPVAFMGGPVLSNNNGPYYAVNHAHHNMAFHNGIQGLYSTRRSVFHGVYQCPRCQNFLMGNINSTSQHPACPSCQCLMHRIQ